MTLTGGAADVDAYLSWLGSLAAGIEDRRAVVVLEPDAVPHAVEGCTGSADPAERYRLLTEAVRILQRQPGVAVYVDAGNAFFGPSNAASSACQVNAN